MNQEVMEMIFSSNENMLINLLNFEEYVSAKYLSKALYVSTKTVYRMIKKINELFLEEKQEALIISEPGKGHKLSDTFRNKNLHSIVEFTEENSLNELVLALLFNHPKKINRAVLNTQFLSNSSIERRLKKINEIVNKYNIQLKVNRDYLWVIGDEIDLRRAIIVFF